MRTFHTMDSRTLSYVTRGSGAPVVMLAGGPGLDPAAFYADVDLPGFQRLVFCPRGTGESDPPDSPDGYRIAGYVDDLDELHRHLGSAQLTLYGSSHGASTALAYARTYPEQVDRMVLASGPARLNAPFAEALTGVRQRFAETVPDGAERLRVSDEAGPRMRSATSDEDRCVAIRAMMNTYVAHQNAVGTDFLDRLAAAPMNFAAPGPMVAEMMGGLNLLKDAHTISASTLVLTGELDVRVPTQHMHEIADAIPAAQLVRFPDVGHLIHIEAPAEWGQTVSDFLAGGA